jgi:hypothetical protein
MRRRRLVLPSGDQASGAEGHYEHSDTVSVATATIAGGFDYVATPATETVAYRDGLGAAA